MGNFDRVHDCERERVSGKIYLRLQGRGLPYGGCPDDAVGDRWICSCGSRWVYTQGAIAPASIFDFIPPPTPPDAWVMEVDEEDCGYGKLPEAGWKNWFKVW